MKNNRELKDSLLEGKSGNGTKALLGCVVLLILVPVFLVIDVIWWGFVISTLWNWFVPGIFGLATLTLLQSYGLYLVARVLTFNPLVGKNSALLESLSDKESIKIANFSMFFVSLIAGGAFLLIGWAIQFFM